MPTALPYQQPPYSHGDLPLRSTAMYMATQLHQMQDIYNVQHAREQTVEALIANGFPYSKKLTGHTSCVNSLAFSSGDGRWLASAGDDSRVHLFDFHQEDVVSPSCSFVGPRSNVFSLCFSANNRYLYCGATDALIYKYDLSEVEALVVSNARGSPCEILLGHDDSIRDITCHPWNDDVIMSASEDGRIILRDVRGDNRLSRAEGTLQSDAEFTGVRWNPRMEHVFSTSDNRGRVCLRDTRMTFGAWSSRSSKPLQQFITTLSKPSVTHLSNPEISSIVWDRDGSKLAVNMQNYYPTIFSLKDPLPLAICSARFLPDGTPTPTGQRTYVNSCTIKHGSFGGPALARDSYFASGSDNFRGYVWKIPDLAHLMNERKQVDAAHWPAEEPTTIAFAQKLDGIRYIPVNLAKPLFHLDGHQSIVNSVLFHPNLLHICTAGVERHITLHSPTTSSPCTKSLQLTSAEVRSLPERGSDDSSDRVTRALLTGEGAFDPEEDDDSDTIALFDEILRNEGGDIDPFMTRRFLGNNSDFEDEEDSDMEINCDD